MPEQPSEIAREAKHLHQGLKDLLKKNEPWGRDVEYQRKQLRRRYLQLLLCHPYAKESQDAENHLWMQTSYSFIAAYKQQVSALDKLVANLTRQQVSKGGHGPVEQRKLLNRFKQFLAEEEKFWTDLVERIYRSFGLEEAKSALVALEIIPVSEDAPTPGPENAQRANGRNQHLSPFPAQENVSARAPPTSSQRESRLAILSKALIRLGDLARYRELYNESGGRPKAGQEDGARRHGRIRRGGVPTGMETMARPRNYEKAQACYQQSKNLQPDDGNPSHQLAILASYQKDIFGSLVHYYRSLCVLRPAEMASENMGTALAKALDAWKAKKTDADVPEGQEKRTLPPPVRIETLQDNTVALHASWRLGVNSSTEPELAQAVFDDFSALISERHLPPEMIAPFILLSQGALWEHQHSPKFSKDTRTSLSPEILEGLEHKKLYHLLNMHQALLETGSAELEEPLPKDVAEGDPAQRITATFRRTLTALRIASRWLRANIQYVIRTGIHSLPAMSSHTRIIMDFWTAYARFCCLLARSFPLSELPRHASPLEEDMELTGFLPLGQLPTSEKVDSTLAHKSRSEQVHPNVEHLMRIRDLLEDAQYIAGLEKSPIASYDTLVSMERGNGFELAPSTRERAATIMQDQTSMATLTEVRNQRLQAAKPREEDAMTVSTDDPVRDAFRKVLDGSDLGSGESLEDDDDEIVWDLKGSASPALAATATPLHPQSASPVTPQKPIPIGTGKPTLSPSRQSLAPFGNSPPGNIGHGTPTTAQDLLHNVMGGATRRPSDAFRPSPSEIKGLPPPQLLFGTGAGPNNQTGSSIWSNAGTSQWQHGEPARPVHGSAPSAMRPSEALPMLTSPDIPNAPNPWPVSFAPGSPNFSNHPHQTSPMHPYSASPQQHLLQSAHQRSISMSVPQGYSEGTPRPPDFHALYPTPSGYTQHSVHPTHRPFPGNIGPLSHPHPAGSIHMNRPDPTAMMHSMNHHTRHVSLTAGQVDPGVFNGHLAPLPHLQWGGHG